MAVILPFEKKIYQDAIFSGAHLTAAMNLVELDNYVELIDVYIAYVEIIINIYIRSSLGHLAPRFTVSRIFQDQFTKKTKHSIHGIELQIERLVRLVKLQLHRAEGVADFIESDYAKLRIAKMRIHAERVLGGFSNWRSPKTYFGSRKSEREAWERLTMQGRSQTTD